MKTTHAALLLCGALLPLGNLGLAGSGSMSSTRFQYRQLTGEQRAAMQQARDQAAQAPATQTAAGSPGPVGTPGPASEQAGDAGRKALHR